MNLRLFNRSRVRGLALAALAAGLSFSASAANNLVLVSRTIDGGPALTGATGDAPAISGDGRYVAFRSNAENFGAATQGWEQVYVRDLNTNSLRLVSKNAAGQPADSRCFQPAISGDGRYVVFVSYARNLAPVPEGTQTSVFLRDTVLGTTEAIAPQDDAQTGSRNSVTQLGVSGNGRFVAFCSYHRGLVPNDTNDTVDVFVKDRQLGTIERVSVSTAGQQADAQSGIFGISMSDDGRYVSFNSPASNLVAGDTNDYEDVFVRDRQLQTTTRINLTSAGEQLTNGFGGSLSADGRYVAFFTHFVGVDPNFPTSDGICVRDRVANTTEIVSMAGNVPAVGNFGSLPAISRNGRWVVFQSDSPDFTPGDTNGINDVFVRDRQNQSTLRMSAPDGVEPDRPSGMEGGPCISDDGMRTVFVSSARNQVEGDTNGKSDAFVRDLDATSPVRVSVAADGREGVTGAMSTAPVISADGRLVVFWSDAFNLIPGDTNGAGDIFASTRATGAVERVSVSSAGAEAAWPSPYPAFDIPVRPAVSADGRYVAFVSSYNTLVPDDTNQVPDVFVHDRTTGTTERVSVASSEAQGMFGSPFVVSGPAISGDGRYVVFSTDQSNLVPGEFNQMSDLFLRDRTLGTTERLSLASDGGEPNGPVDFYGTPTISRDGQIVVFGSWASNLVPGGSPAGIGTFIRNRGDGSITRLPAATAFYPTVSGDGRYVVFSSADTDLVPGDTNGWPDVFVYDRFQWTIDLVSVARDGGQFPGGALWGGAISDDGRYVAIAGFGDSPADGDNWTLGLYRRDRELGATELLSPTTPAGRPLTDSYEPALSSDGTVVGFAGVGPLPMVGSTSRVGREVLVRALGMIDLAAPTDLLTTPVSATSLRLTWADQSTAEDGFAIERSFGAGNWQEVGSAPANAEEYLDTGLQPDTGYSYRIRAYNNDGFSPYSEAAPGRTFRLAPQAPSGLSGAAESATVVLLSWLDQSDRESGFVIWKSHSGGAPEFVGTAGENATGYRDETALDDTVIRYFVRAYNEGGESASVEVEVTTPPFPPTIPTGVTARAVGATTVRLEWESDSRATSFRIERKADGGVFTQAAVLKGGIRSFLDVGLTSGVVYTYRIIASNGHADSAPSAEAMATIPAAGGMLSVTPAKLNFGTVKRGKTKRMTLKLKNKGRVAVSGEVGTLTAPYLVLSGGYFSLAAGATQKVVVEFAPTAAGPSSRTLAVTSTASAVAAQVPVTGRGK
ncbi:MAG: hypothetical protein K0Q72_3046 [Armatimonadetes bacterium]|jgi:Tol biopolymer transport system component|nr:hypothetical protein [Armatimonadota bacterium]